MQLVVLLAWIYWWCNRPFVAAFTEAVLGFGEGDLKVDGRAIVRKMDRDTMNGYVASANFIVEGKLEMLNTAGNVVGMELSDIKVIYFVREFGENGSPVRKTFANRPRTEGLWARLKFKDNDVVEGMMPNDLTQTQAEGFRINPPDTSRWRPSRTFRT